MLHYVQHIFLYVSHVAFTEYWPGKYILNIDLENIYRIITWILILNIDPENIYWILTWILLLIMNIDLENIYWILTWITTTTDYILNIDLNKYNYWILTWRARVASLSEDSLGERASDSLVSTPEDTSWSSSFPWGRKPPWQTYH